MHMAWASISVAVRLWRLERVQACCVASGIYFLQHPGSRSRFLSADVPEYNTCLMPIVVRRPWSATCAIQMH